MQQQGNTQTEEPELLTAQQSDPQSDTKQKRSVRPTWKLQENYEADKEELLSNISHVWSKTVECMSALSQPTHEVSHLEGAVKHLNATYETYQRLSHKYADLLKRYNTENSLQELRELHELNLERDDLVIQTRAKTDVKMAHLYDSRSHLSTTSRRSTRSSNSLRSTSSTLNQQLIKARADAEASKIQAAFAQKKAQMEAEAAQKKAQMEAEAAQMEAEAAQKKAQIEAEAAQKTAQMEALERQCEHAKDMARLRVLEQAASDYDRGGSSNHSVGSYASVSSQSSPKLHRSVTAAKALNQGVLPTFPVASQVPETGLDRKDLPHYHTNHPTNLQLQVNAPLDSTPAPVLNASAPSYVPKSFNYNIPATTTNPVPPAIIYPRSENTDMTQFAKYILRRELTRTGLTMFDDKPENYRGWKYTFKATISELDITAAEELDLLIRWLGPQSAERIKRLKTVYTSNPAKGLDAAWDRLEHSFGSSEAIEDALLKRLQVFPRITVKDNLKFQELSDLLLELQLAKADPRLPGLSYLDTPRGINPIVLKLPYGTQEKWVSQGSSYKKRYGVAYPPFSYFCNFIKEIADSKNDPSFAYGDCNSLGPPSPGLTNTRTTHKDRRGPVSVKRTDVQPAPATVVRVTGPNKKLEDPNRECPIHKKPHPLKKCNAFRKKPLQERKELLKEFGVCFRCCASTEHLAKDCKVIIKCNDCGSDKHVQALHVYRNITSPPKDIPPRAKHGGEHVEQTATSTPVSSTCTTVCGEGLCEKSCAKICLVHVYAKGQPERAIRLYTILDDQSNQSLASTRFFDLLGIKGDALPYTLGTCAGITEVLGRRASGLVVTPLNNNLEIPLPTIMECNLIPTNKDEIPTPEAALHHDHLKDIADQIPTLDENADILLLLGRDILRVHKVRHQISGPHDAPYAQRLDLGWVIIGNVCLDNDRKPHSVSSFKTHILPNGRATCLPRQHHYSVKERLSNKGIQESIILEDGKAFILRDDNIGNTVFEVTKKDNELATTMEDKEFLKIMSEEFYQDDSNSWVAPLPFRTPKKRMPNNRQHADLRFISLERTLNRKPEMKKHFVDFMQKMFERDHVELAPPLSQGEECWYLPCFGVYHPRKPDQIRVVFDSSARYEGVSLNDNLLSGPNLNNNLLGVLLRFRQEPIAIMADIQQMFHCFIVREDNRNFLRFRWYRNNDVNNEVIDYRMKVHVFGNSPSPAVAIYGLRKTAKEGEEEFGTDARQFVERNFYVDDGLKSLPTEEEAIDLLTRTQNMLATANLRLHKIISNSNKVMRAFHSDDYAASAKELQPESNPSLTQRSLGLLWDVKKDMFTFLTSACEKPFTKRGILSAVNSIYDPLGFIAPFTIQGKILLRQLTTEKTDWDTPLPKEKQQRWESWKQSVQALEQFKIPRYYIPVSLKNATRLEVHVFSDASMEAIAAVAYLRVVRSNSEIDVGFIMGKTKLTPKPAHTIPRLELCAATLAVEIAEVIENETDFDIHSFEFYTDSKIVLGYLHNQTRQFHVYVSNRVDRIRKFSTPEQWHYVPTDLNPADLGSRAVPAAAFLNTSWIYPPVLLNEEFFSGPVESTFELLHPESDKEIKATAVILITSVEATTKLKSHRFERFSKWSSAVRAIARLIHVTHYFASKGDTNQECSKWHICKGPPTIAEVAQAERVIIQCLQHEVYSQEIYNLSKGLSLSKDSPLYQLNPTIDPNKLLRVGGRISRSNVVSKERNPLIIPGRHHITTMIVRHCHEQVQHQGRHFTEGAVRAAGFWIIGMKRCISSILHKCVKCQRLRGKHLNQQMAELPRDRLSTEPPFTNVGIDVFGPWSIVTRKTRGGVANNKRWAVLFTCLSIRAVHIEVIESMDSSCFINAFRRFVAIRGPVKLLRSDCGTNFTGAEKIENFFKNNKCKWEFNPPHSSHMGGSWERMIGISRKILDSMLLDHKSSRLTHEVLVTFLAEVSAIINARPLVPISSDPESPVLLTPATLLTQKIGVDTIPPQAFDCTNVYTYQWKRVQHLANTFWSRWKMEYLCNLQSRRKWQVSKPNLQVGDVVLLKEKDAHRNNWPTGLITKTVPSNDGKVRKAEVKVIKEGSAKHYYRPITELVLLLPKQEDRLLTST